MGVDGYPVDNFGGCQPLTYLMGNLLGKDEFFSLVNDLVLVLTASFLETWPIDCGRGYALVFGQDPFTALPFTKGENIIFSLLLPARQPNLDRLYC
jgi:hypothetical protein